MLVDSSLIGSKAVQSLFENESWIRIIEFLSQENTVMKNRLSEVIDQIHDRDDLAMAEHYQNQFIIKDDLFDHMMHDLQAESEKWKSPRNTQSLESISALTSIHEHLKVQIEFIEKDHAIIRKDYNSYLNKVIGSF